MIFNREEDSKICIICGKKKDRGININNAFICSECESEIVITEVESKRYHFFVKKMKDYWLKNA